MASSLETKFLLLWRAMDGPALMPEMSFHPDRGWRFDYAHEATRIAIEIEGGVWSGGRHTRGGGFVKDCEKYNTAQLMGWRVFRLTGEMISEKWLDPIMRLIVEQSHGEDRVSGAVYRSPAESRTSQFRQAVENCIRRSGRKRMRA